jgi:hypothetical protein
VNDAASAIACDGDSIGAIRYNTGTGAFEGCNGTTWADIRNGATGTAAGSDRQIQFNSAGAFGASANLVFTSAGRLGIGTATPAAGNLLDVEGSVLVNTGNAVVSGGYFGESSSAVTGVLLNSAGTDWGTIQNDAANTWSLGHKTDNTAAVGTPVLTWTVGGNVGINTATPGEMLFVSGGNLAATGKFGSGPALAESGAGTRMVWYPQKAAFRAGTAGGTEWDDANIGAYSVAMGYANKASGAWSTAFGENSFAQGGAGMAWGDGAYANGAYSTAGGFNNVAGGLVSTALGGGTTANGDYSTALGALVTVGDGTPSDGKGNNSMAIGLTATGTATLPQVQGVGSLGIFMQDQHNDVISASNVMALMGGKLYIDPSTGGGKTVASARATLDLGAATDAILLPSGTTAQQPGTPVNGMIRYNSQTGKFEGYQAGAWINMIGGGAAAGSTKQVQYNSGGAFTASSAFTWDDASGTLTLTKAWNPGLHLDGTGGNTADVSVGSSGLWLSGTAGIDLEYGGGNVMTIGNGAVGMGTGSGVAPGAALDVQLARTAASGVAYGARLQQTLTAAANNDVLTGLYINPTFADNAKTGVVHSALTINAGTGWSYSNPNAVAGLRIVSAGGYGDGVGFTSDAKNGYIWYTGNGDSWVGVPGSIAFVPNNTWSPSDIKMVITNPGKVGIGTATPGEILFVSGGNLAAIGTYGAGSAIAESGAGTRMMWYPKKAAFRAGNVSGTQWDDANIGTYSTAFGYNTTASGSYSTAMGWSTTASNSMSTAFGGGSTASGYASTALGNGNTASGYASTASGDSNTASGMWSTALGNYTTAAGTSSTALGRYVKAGDTAGVNGMYSMAIGLNNTSTTNYADLTGTGSLMIAMQDQHNVVMTANNAMALLGGSMIINPATGSGGAMVSTPDTALDVRGSIKVGDGAETCGATYAGAIRYNTGAVQFCNGAAWANIASAGGARLDQITAATGPNTINNGNNAQNWQWNTLGSGGTGLSLSTTTTAAGIQKLLNMSMSGIVPSGSDGTSYGAYISDTHTSAGGGGTSTNIGLYATASGGTSNYAAIFDQGNVGIGTTAPTYPLSFTGQSAQEIWMERETTAATPGFGLTVAAGGAVLGGTDKAGGDLTLSGGTATGTADSKIIFKGAPPQASTSTTDNVPAEIGRITGGGYMQFTGTFGSGDTMLAATGTATPGAGTRMVWYPRKAAFRVGTAVGTEWDDANIGQNSMAFGLATTASGTDSAAFGRSTIASGSYSTASGFTTTASGMYSTAIGISNTASGPASTAFGQSNTVSGNSSTVGGYNNTVSGTGSTAFGGTVTASGFNSTALGAYVMAGDTADTNGNNSMAIGLTSTNGGVTHYPKVTGTGSALIAMQNQTDVNMTANNAMALLGGSMIINPATGSGAGMISTPDTALDVRGSIKVGDGAETCGATYAGAIRYNTGAVQFCNGTAWANIASAGATAAGSTKQVQYNSGGAFTASSAFTWDDATGTLTLTKAWNPGLHLDGTGGNTADVGVGSSGLWLSATAGIDMEYGGTNIMTIGNGAVGMGTGSGVAPGAALDVQLARTAASGVAYGGRFQQTLTASADNNSLIGLYINPTFADAGKANVVHNGLVVNNGAVSISNFEASALFVTTNRSSSTGTEEVKAISVGPAITVSTAHTVPVGGVDVDALVAIGGVASLTDAYGVRSRVEKIGSPALTNAYAFYARPPVILSGSITNAYGLYLENITGATNNYAIYSAGGQSYFAGSVGIGVVSPATKLDVNGTVMVADGGESCSATVKGGIRYTSANTLQYCDSSAWKTVSTGSGSAAGTNTQVQFNSGGAFGASANFTWNNSTSTLTVGNYNTGAASGVYQIAGTTVLTYPNAGADTGSFAAGPGALATQSANSLANTALGANAGQYISTGKWNTAVGAGAMTGVSGTPLTGIANTAVGLNALSDIQGAATQNTMVGAAAGQWLTTGSNNTAVGQQAMFDNGVGNITGSNNTAVGQAALIGMNGAAASNTAVGQAALKYNDTGSSNTAVGQAAMQGITGTRLIGTSNTAVGGSALLLIQGTAANNTAVGLSAGAAVTTGTDNTLLGYQSGQLVTGNYNIMVGEAGNITTGSGNILIGNSLTGTTAGSSNQLDIGDLITGTIGSGLVTINGTGALTLPSGTTAQQPAGVNGMIRYNSTIGKFEGYQAGAWQNILTGSGGVTKIDDLSDAVYDITTDHNMVLGSNTAPVVGAQFNVWIGEGAGKSTTNAADQNTAIGYHALNANTSGSENTSIGSGALGSNLTGLGNTAVGNQVLNANIGTGNTAVGDYALNHNIGGSYNVAIGTSDGSNNDVLFSNTSGSYNVAIGANALTANTTSSNITAVGAGALLASTGANNTALGYNAGDAGTANTTGSSDTFIGYQAQSSASNLTNATALGANAVVGASNSLVLGNAVNVGIGTAAPGELLFVSGGNLVATGTFGSGSTIAESGAGTRMMWYPKKAAFRAGNVTGTAWDDANIGPYSMALGQDTVASGANSMAWGSGATASGLQSTAFGLSPTASGGLSTAWGRVTTASGTNATAWGRATTASSIYSTAWGLSTTANGSQSTAWGQNTTAAGTSSSALGQYVMAGDTADTNGMYSMAIGLTNTSTATNAKVTGNGSMGIFMQDQHNKVFAANNTMGLFGGALVIDPNSQATQFTARGVLDLGAATDAVLLPGGTTAQQPAGVNGMIRYNSTTGKFEGYQAGAWQDILTSASTGATAMSSITAATGANTINSAANAQEWDWNSLTTGNALTLGSTSMTTGSILFISSSSTAASAGQKGLNVSLSGAGSPGTGTTYGAYITNTHSGGTTANVGLYASASSGTAGNYAALFAAGNVGIGTVVPAAALDVQGAVTAAGAVAYGVRQQQTLTAAANNDALYGLYLNTTYADASKTGVTHTDLGFEGSAARLIAVRRNPAPPGAVGLGLTINAGGTSGGPDKAGGDLTLSGGTATGTADSKIIFNGSFPQAATNTTDNVPTEVGRITGGGYVQFTGTNGSGDTMLAATGTATPGLGTRMVWYPRKAAFRAGYVDLGSWDDANIGLMSTAFGYDTTASGTGSAAFGDNATASGYDSMAFGSGANASGNYSAAYGSSTTAAGTTSTALGGYVMAGDTANVNGMYSMAIGLSSVASYAKVTGAASLMIAMQDQTSVNMTATNAMALLGGKMIINPATALGAGMVSTPDTALDVRGSIKVGDGAETCGATYAGAIRYNTGAMQVCNGTSWANISTPAGSDTYIQFNNAGAFGASSSLSWNGSTLVVGAASGASLTIGASGASTSKINIGPTMGAAAPNSNIGAAAVATSETTTSTTFAALTTAGPIVTMTTGVAAIVTVTAKMSNNTAADGCMMGFAVSGATVVASSTTQAALETSSAAGAAYQMSATFYVTGLTAGSNTFTAQYAAVTGGTCTYVNRNMVVMLP